MRWTLVIISEITVSLDNSVAIHRSIDTSHGPMISYVQNGMQNGKCLVFSYPVPVRIFLRIATWSSSIYFPFTSAENVRSCINGFTPVIVYHTI